MRELTTIRATPISIKGSTAVFHSVLEPFPFILDISNVQNQLKVDCEFDLEALIIRGQAGKIVYGNINRVTPIISASPQEIRSSWRRWLFSVER